MVAVIHAGKSLREALNYNENKVSRGVAELIDAGYYLKNAGNLRFAEKLSRLQNLIDLNERVKVNTLHISLNFAAEDELDKTKLRQISADYLDKIGFTGQPYLLYQHHDAGHRHVHIITTNIRPDGRGISLHNIGKIRSENARKELEDEYGLVKAEGHKREVYALKPISLTRAEYGKAQTKQTISGVLDRVLKTYMFSSLAELNAALFEYGVRAEQGAEGSRIRQNKGLIYYILDRSGERVGVGVKASDFHFKPTHANLEILFAQGNVQRQKYSSRLRNTIDNVLDSRGPTGLPELKAALRQQGVSLHLRSSQQGNVYGVTYVDHRTKAVFNGSDLGKDYSAKRLIERLDRGSEIRVQKSGSIAQAHAGLFDLAGQSSSQSTTSLSLATSENDLIWQFPDPVANEQQVPWQLRKKRKRKKGRSI